LVVVNKVGLPIIIPRIIGHWRKI